MNQKSNPSSFAAIETALVIIILAMVGFTGWFVWHSKEATDKTLSDTAKSSPVIIQAKKVTNFTECKKAPGSKILTTYPERCVTKAGKTFTDSNQTTQKYITIKEWGVRAPYEGTLTLSYKLNSNGAAYFSAKQMDDLVVGTGVSCEGFAGSVMRYSSNQVSGDGSGKTVSEEAAIDNSYTRVGDYYYLFGHAQSFCAGALPSPLTSSQQEQLAPLIAQANNDVKAIAAHLQAIN